MGTHKVVRKLRVFGAKPKNTRFRRTPVSKAKKSGCKKC